MCASTRSCFRCQTGRSIESLSCEILLAHHAAIERPDALGLAITGLHRGDNLLQRRRIVAIAGEHFVTERQPAPRHHQTDADLLAVGPMVARVAALGQRIGVGLALEVRARYVVQQQIVLDGEQLAEPLLEKRLERRLVRQHETRRGRVA